MKDLIEYLVGEIVQDDIEVTTQESANAIDVEVRVPDDKVGLIIGKDGCVVKAIRRLALVGKKEPKKISINVSSLLS